MSKNSLSEKYRLLFPYLDERTKRMVCAADAKAIGHGGVKQVEEASGLSRMTITKGKKELEGENVTQDTDANNQQDSRIRKEGGGRKKLIDQQQSLKQDLESLVDPYTRGDPESPLKWTTKSLRKLEAELKARSYNISYVTVKNLLKEMGYSLQSQAKVKEGKGHPDRDSQFRYINNHAKKFLETEDPVISVDTKKKELVGDFKNQGREYRPKGDPIETSAYDFPSLAEAKAIPYGVYDIAKDEGWVSVGIDKDTAMFAVNSIRNWWHKMGTPLYSNAGRLLITADNGGSNGSKNRLWKKCLQDFANETGLDITVCHFPPGTSKWNKIEHSLFSFITMNWRGHQLLSLQTIINLINAVKTNKGLKVKAELDQGSYEKGIKVSDDQMKEINCQKHEFHGDWNYTISPA